MINQNTCGALIKQIHDSLEKRSNNALRPHGLTLSQINILLVLNETENNELSLKAIEQIFNVAQSTIAGIVTRLEQKGLVKAFGDPKDKRIKIIHITEEGITRCKEAQQNMSETDEQILHGFTDIEKNTFISLLLKVKNNLS